MAGLHFSCGDWLGEDKSADILFDILDLRLKAFITAEEDADWASFTAAYRRQSRRRTLTLDREMMARIIGPLRRYRDALTGRMGRSGAEGPLMHDEERLDCVQDLLRGYEVCEKTGEPIVVYYA